MPIQIESESTYREGRDFSKVAIIALFILSIGFVVYIAKLGGGVPRMGQFREEPTSTVQVGQGKLTLKTKDPKKDFTLGEQVSLLVYADSANRVINGFDIVLNYAPDALRYINTSGTLEDFQIVAVARDDRLTITGFKKLNVKTKKVLTGEPIAEVVFTPVKSGQISLEPTFVPGKTTNSNLVDEAGRQTLGKVEGVSFTVK